MKKKIRFNWNIVIITLIIIIGVVPRAVEVFSGNYLFGFDQGLFFEKVKRIVVDHKFTLIGEEVGGRGGFFQGPGFYYLLAIPFYLWGGNPYGATVLMFIVGAATLVTTAVMAHKRLGWTEAIVIVFLMAVSPKMVSQSRFIWNPFFVPPLAVIALFLFYDVLKGRAYRLPWVFVVVGLIFHFEIASGIVMAIEFVLFSLYLLWRRIVRGRDLLFSALSFGTTQLHFLLFDLRHDFLITRGIINTLIGKAPHEITRVYVQHMFGNHWNVFKYNFLSVFPYSGEIWSILLLIIFIGLYFMLRDKNVERERKHFLLFLASMPIVTFALYMKYLWPMWEWWILELGVVYILVLGMILSWMWQKRKPWKFFVIGLVVLFLFFHIRSTIDFYRVDFRDYGGTHKIRGKLDAIDAIYMDAKGQPFNILVYSPPIYTYPYDYLFWWYGGKKYGFVPGHEKEGIFYLLIEPDPSKPWGYKGWQETIIKTGEVMSRWELPSGFIIEKRKAIL